MTALSRTGSDPTLAGILGDEGLRLFFPLSALHAALWPLLWAVVNSFAMPFDGAIPPVLWHGHEMLFGAFGAAVIGFVTTAIPEWTDTRRLQGRALFALAGLWGIGRAGFLFAAGASFTGGVAYAGAAMHAWTAGAIGVLMLAVETRSLLDRVAFWLTAVIHTVVAVATVAQIAAVLIPKESMLLMPLSGIAWIIAFLLFGIVHGRTT